MFDMDGLLVDSEPLWLEAETAVMARLGADWTAADQVQLLGGSLDRTVRYLLGKASRAASPGQVAEWLMSGIVELARAHPACLGARLTGGGFPYGTIGVNLIGSFLIVVVMQLGLVKGTISPDLRVILATGVMGGFTTYSAFNYETVQLLRTGAVGFAALNLGVTLVGCLLAAGAGSGGGPR